MPGGVDDDFQESLRKLFDDELFRLREGQTYEQRCALTYERLALAGDRLPPASELLRDPVRLFTFLEWAAVFDPSLFLASTLHMCLSLGAIVEFGGGDAASFVRELDAMESFGALLVTEFGRGNSHLGIRTEAVYDPCADGFVLHTPDDAARKFMPNVGLAGVPKLGVVYARLLVRGRDHGVFPFVTRIRTADGLAPGIEVTPLPEAPFLPLDYAVISFDRCRIPRAALLPDDARLDAGGTLHDPLADPGRRLRRSLDIRHTAWVASAAALAAVGRAGVTAALRHALDRPTVSPFTTERGVLDHRAQQRPLFGALAASHALTCLVNNVKEAWAGRGSAEQDSAWRPGPALNRTCGVVKAAASRLAAAIAAECGQRCGAHGMFAAGRWTAYQGFAHMLGPAAGDSYLIVLETARAMAVGDHYDPPPGGVPAGGDLLDPRLWVALTRTRERRLHRQLSEQVRLAARRGQSGYDAWNNRSLLGRELVEAHAARLMTESAVGAPGFASAATRALVGLRALDELDRHAGWYLCEGLLSADDVRRIPVLANELCDRIRPEVEALLASLPAPDDVLVQQPAFPRKW